MAIATNVDIELKQLERYANQFLQENYNLELRIPLTINGRLTRSMGRYVYGYNGTPKRIELAKFLLQYAHEVIIYSVLRHELIHYAMHILGKPSDDGHPEFENELSRHSALSTEMVLVGKYYQLKCDICNNKTVTQKKSIINNLHKYKTSCCNSTLSFEKEIIYNGLEYFK